MTQDPWILTQYACSYQIPFRELPPNTDSSLKPSQKQKLILVEVGDQQTVSWQYLMMVSSATSSGANGSYQHSSQDTRVGNQTQGQLLMDALAQS